MSLPTRTTLVSRRWPAIAALVTSLAGAEGWSSEEPPPPPPAAQPLRESAARLLRKLDEEGKAPCAKAPEGVPCFPVSIEQSRPDLKFSVRDSLNDLGTGGKQSPSRPPTLEELKPFRPGPVGPVGAGFGFDPVCVGKSALKRLKGRNDTYYLYRVRDTRGERVALYGHRVDAATFQGALEFLGRFDGECQALAAYRHEGLKTVATKP